MATLVAPPERTPLTGGLFSVLSFPENGTRWEMGVTYPGQTCGLLPVSAGPGCPPDDPDADPEGYPIPADREQPWREETATFTVSGVYTCSPVGITLAEAEDNAVADLQRHEEATVEDRIWRTVLADADPVEGVTAPVSIDAAVGILEQYIGATYGVQGIIHAPRWLVPSMDVTLRGQRLTTENLGTPLVAGSGYGTTGTTTTLVATPAMVGYRSQAEVVGTPEETFDRGQNLLQVLAQRTYLIGFDTCPPASITVDLTL